MRFDSGVDDEIINDIVINDNGKILAVGTRTNTLFVSKINSDGTLDLSFNSVGYKLFPLPSGHNRPLGFCASTVCDRDVGAQFERPPMTAGHRARVGLSCQRAFARGL